jgi:hemoglobin/transferrin/lactoferrin receptor protein
MRFTKLVRAAMVVAGLYMGVGGPLEGQVAGRTVSATIRDSISGAPISGVEIVAGGRRVATDSGGQFRVRVTSDTVTVLIRRIGYAPRSFAVRDLPEVVYLKLEPVLLTGLTVTVAVPPDIGAASSLGVTTVEHRDLAPRAETSLASALGGVEGLSSQQPGAWGGKAFLRGLGGERVTVLVDGDRVNRACNFGMDGSLATVSPATVERVEVLSGPGSVLYGSGNMGGVINVVTRTSDDARRMGGELRAGASSAVPGGTVGGAYYVQGSRLRLDLSADGASYSDYRSGAGSVGGSSYRDATVDGRLAWTVSSEHRLQARVQRYLGRDIGYPAMAGTEIPAEDRLLTALDYGWQVGHGLVDAVGAKVYRQGLDHDMQMTMTMGSPMPMTVKSEAQTSSVTWGGRTEVRLNPSSRSRIDAGVEATQWNADGTRWVTRGAGSPMSSTLTAHVWPDVRLLDAGGFAQGEVQVTSVVALSAGGRLDRVVNRADGYATRTEWVPSGNVGLRVVPAGGVMLRGSLGYGYRVADPTELFGLAPRPDGYLYLGNPDLQTETSRNIELGGSLSRGRLELGATVYRNRLWDLITPVLLTDSTIAGYAVRQYTNLARARVEGVTGRVGVALPARFSLSGVISYARGTNLDTDDPLPTMPPLEGTVAVRYSPAAFVQWGEVELHGAAEQGRAATATGEIRTPGFVVLNARVMLALLGTDLALGVDNIFDKEYRQHLDPVTLYRPGRNFYVRARMPL